MKSNKGERITFPFYNLSLHTKNSILKLRFQKINVFINCSVAQITYSASSNSYQDTYYNHLQVLNLCPSQVLIFSSFPPKTIRHIMGENSKMMCLTLNLVKRCIKLVSETFQTSSKDVKT